MYFVQHCKDVQHVHVIQAYEHIYCMSVRLTYVAVDGVCKSHYGAVDY